MTDVNLTADSGADRRAFPRYPIPVGVKYAAAGEAVESKALDISEGGIAFSGEKSCEVGKVIELDFWFDSPVNKLFKVKAVVRHAHGNRVGAEFVGIDTVDRTEILQAIYRYLAVHSDQN